MQITLAINTEAISPRDAELLRVIAGLATDTISAATETASEATEGISEATERSGGVPAPEEDERPSETPSVDAEEPTVALLDEAISRATHLIRKEKRGAEVKEALSKVGVEKVTHLTDDETIRRFLDALPQD